MIDSIIERREKLGRPDFTDLDKEVREYITLLIRYRNEMIRYIERGDHCGPVDPMYRLWFGNDLDMMIQAKLL